MSDSRDIQHGVNDPVSRVDVKHRFRTARRRMNARSGRRTCALYPRPMQRKSSGLKPCGVRRNQSE